ncbi:MAG: hypothetical protein JSS85_11365 [Bacteroidetes bacterium]|nr:hypothetical protein [Bacteroidota bacterium]
MKIKNLVAILLLCIIFSGCSKEFDCIDFQIQPSFINYSISDIDTIILRKFKPNDSYQTLLDSFIVVYGYTGQYHTSNDTTSILIPDGTNGIKAGFDWQIFIPSKSKTVYVSDIISEKKTRKCNRGLFSLDPFGCNCINKVFSLKKDNQLISFPNTDTTLNTTFYIRN